jgi:proliferating cell nuclear antigen PCNA
MKLTQYCILDYMDLLRIKLDDKSTLVKLLNVIPILYKRLPIICNEKMIQTLSTSSDVGCIINFEIHGKKLPYYCCDNEMKFGIDISCLKEMVQTVNNNCKMEIFISTQNPSILVIIYETSPNNPIYSEVTLPLVQVDYTNIDIFKFKYEVMFRIDAKEYSDICNSIKKLKGGTSTNPKVDIEFRDGYLKFMVARKGDKSYGYLESNHKIIKFRHKKKISIGKKYHKSYDMTKLDAIRGLSSLSKDVLIYMADERPLFVKFSIMDIGCFRIFITPINSD